MTRQTTMNQDMQRCIEICEQCHRTCLQTAMGLSSVSVIGNALRLRGAAA